MAMLRVALCVSCVLAVTLAKAAELETTHLFGFTFGSDVNAVGEREAESEAVGRFGKSAGTYGAISQALGPVDSKDSLLGANQIQSCFWGGSLGCEGPFGFERCGMGADGALDHRPARPEGLHWTG